MRGSHRDDILHHPLSTVVYDVGLCTLTFIGWFCVREPEQILVRPSLSLFTFGHSRSQTHGILLIVPVRHRFPQGTSPNPTLHPLFQFLLVLDDSKQVGRVPTYFLQGFERRLSGLQLGVLGAQSQGEKGRAESDSSPILSEPFYLLHHLRTSTLLQQRQQSSGALHADLTLLSGSVDISL